MILGDFTLHYTTLHLKHLKGIIKATVEMIGFE